MSKLNSVDNSILATNIAGQQDKPVASNSIILYAMVIQVNLVIHFLILVTYFVTVSHEF